MYKKLVMWTEMWYMEQGLDLGDEAFINFINPRPVQPTELNPLTIAVLLAGTSCDAHRSKARR
jgi:hypothetical protein